MDRAIDFSSGAIVEAINARSSRQYFCPVCLEVVQFVDSVYKKHFKHWHNTKRTDCENYRGGNSTGQNKGWREALERKSRYALYATASETENFSAWHLELYLPSVAFEPEFESVLVHEGCPGPIKVYPPVKQRNGGNRVRVFPRDKYNIQKNISNSDVTSSQTLPGLRESTINVFAYGDSSGRLLDVDTPLLKGNSYILVTHVSNPISLPNSFRYLNKNGDWHAYVVSLPVDLPDKQAAFLERLLLRNIDPPQLTIELMHPIKSIQETTGSFIIEENSEVIISVSGLSKETVRRRIAMKSDKLPNVVWFDCIGVMPLYISLGKLEIGNYYLFIPGLCNAYLDITIVDSFTIVSPSPIQLSFQSSTGEITCIPLYSHEMPNYLSDIAGNKLKLVDIDLSSPVPLYFKMLGTKLTDIQTEKYDIFREFHYQWQERLPYYKDSILNNINSLISDNSEFHLIAGNFGSLFFKQNPKLLSPSLLRLSLPPKTRQTIAWLCTMPEGVSAHSHIIVNDLKQLIAHLLPHLSHQDKNLCAALLKKRGFPDNLSVHVKALILNLRQLIR